MRQPAHTVKDLSRLFRRHKNTIRIWIVHDHLFPHAFRVKDGWLIPDADVQQLARDGRINRAADPQTD